MKPYVLFVVMLLITPVAGLFHMPALSTDVETSSVTTSEMTVEDGTYLSFHFENCQYLHTEGFPVLPYYTKIFTYPLGTKINGVSVKPQYVETRTLSKKIIPSAPAVAANMQGATTPVAREGPVYQQDAFYPPDWYTVHVGVGIVNGTRNVIVSVHFYPLLYNPVSNEVQQARDFDVNVNHELPAQPLLSNEGYDLVIICPEAWEQLVQPLAEHKQNHGIATMVGTVESILATYNGRDDAEKIKYYIKDMVEQQGIFYVLLVGGRHGGLFNEKWWAPVRYAHVDDQSDWETSFLSDLYFSDIYKYENGNPVFDDWDSNGNGVFAEFSGLKKDTVDLIPDVYLGRLACRNENEVSLVVEKIISYETGAYGQQWFNNLVVVGGDSAPYLDDPYFEGEEENKAVIEYLDGFEPTRLWTSLETLTGVQDVINAVNQGCGFLFFDGHGNPMNWATHPPHNESVWIDGLGVRDIPKLTNKDMYPICVVGGCHNAQFNVSVLNALKIWEGRHWYNYVYRGETAYEDWAWRLVARNGGGTIATLGYAGLDWFGVGDENRDGIPDCIQQISGFMNVHFFEQYGVHGLDMLGAAHAGVLTLYATTLKPHEDVYDAKTVEEFVLLGDPSLKIGGYGPL